MNMLFKVDENLPVEIAQVLSDWGHDAKTVNDQRLQGVNDRALLELCDKEKRTLITLDIDFSNIRTYPPLLSCRSCPGRRHAIITTGGA